LGPASSAEGQKPQVDPVGQWAGRGSGKTSADGIYGDVYSLTYEAVWVSFPLAARILRVIDFPSSARYCVRTILLKAESQFRAARPETHRRRSVASRLAPKSIPWDLWLGLSVVEAWLLFKRGSLARLSGVLCKPPDLGGGQLFLPEATVSSPVIGLAEGDAPGLPVQL